MTIIEQKLKSPFPYFGGKSRIAHEVWARFGDVHNYVEPFAGSLAVLLARPTPPRIETVNDINCFLTNFWRALCNDPDGVAKWADYPVSEIDLHARHRWLVAQKDFIEAMRSDPDYYDVQIAGWWVWGICAWIGSGWCRDSQSKRLPSIGTAGRGVHRVNIDNLYNYFAALSARLVIIRAALSEPRRRRAYDLRGLIGQALGLRRFRAPKRFYCSERVARDIRTIDGGLLPEFPTPDQLDIWCEARTDWECLGIHDPTAGKVKKQPPDLTAGEFNRREC